MNLDVEHVISHNSNQNFQSTKANRNKLKEILQKTPWDNNKNLADPNDAINLITIYITEKTITSN